MPVGRIIRHSLAEEVQGFVNGKTRKMTKLAAIIEVQSAKALKGDTRAAKLVIDLGHKHIAPHQTLAEMMGDRPVFSFTEEERARWSTDKLLEGVVLSEHDDPQKRMTTIPKRMRRRQVGAVTAGKDGRRAAGARLAVRIALVLLDQARYNPRSHYPQHRSGPVQSTSDPVSRLLRAAVPATGPNDLP
jgi:hypothetical protein